MTKPVITDICLVTRDLDAAMDWYTEKLDFKVNHRMPGFADFAGAGVTLAVWDAQHIRDTTGVPAQISEPDGRGLMVAVRLAAPAAIDAMHDQLVRRGVDCYGPPKDYPWNARAIYLAGPCGEFWEFYAWHEGGEPGHIESASPTN
jgi:catechol 2,3-dioxygenase-like lactoylglutathione lyase family enzyme